MNRQTRVNGNQPLDREARALEAVNGVEIPSKVKPGQRPYQGRWKGTAQHVHSCSICRRLFATKYQVKVHMAACVERNGNLTGVRWIESMIVGEDWDTDGLVDVDLWYRRVVL